MSNTKMKPTALQIIAVIFCLYIMAISFFTNVFLTVCIVLYTRHGWMVMVLYSVWLYIDKDTIEQGGRRSNWLKSSSIWKHLRDYFPVNLKCSQGAVLDPKKNYLFCSFPHGIMDIGKFVAFDTNACGADKLFPNHNFYGLTLNMNYYIPLRREVILALGICSVSAKSMNYILGKEGGGNVAVLMPGGTKESYFSKPGKHVLYYEKRKGFVKLALKTGTHLVPVFTFGETDLYDQPVYSAAFKKMQTMIESTMGCTILIPKGNGILPFNKPLTLVVGKPLEIPLIVSPTIEEIDKYHALFKQKIIELFEEHKHKYIENPQDKKLVFV